MTKKELFEMQQILAHAVGTLKPAVENCLDFIPDDTIISRRRNTTKKEYCEMIEANFQRLCELSERMLDELEK